jgi:hypothetical protein
MYTNIPTSQITRIISKICKFQNLSRATRAEITKLVTTVLKQNYFKFDNHMFKQIDGLAMGAPTSALFSEIYIQKIEHTKIASILRNNNIHSYSRYVDDILLVYDVTNTDIMTVLNQFNSISSNLQFTAEFETEQQLNFLDLSICRGQEQFEFDIFRKPTTTDHIIPSDSCHPIEHKLCAIRFLHNRMNTYPITDTHKKTERNTIRQILSANRYNDTIMNTVSLNQQHHNTTVHEEKTSEQTEVKRALFTYTGPHTRKITKLFQNAGIKTAFTTKHTVRNLVRERQNQNNFNSCGVYQLECGDCNKKYVGQTGRPFHVRFKEHERDFNNSSSKSLYAKHLLDTGHAMQPIQSCMKILEYQRKSKKLNTLEQYHIYRLCKLEAPLNEQFTENRNPIFETLLKTYPAQQ